MVHLNYKIKEVFLWFLAMLEWVRMIKILVYKLMHLLIMELTIISRKVSGAKKDRPQLEEMINLLREGDSVVIFYKLDRILTIN